MSILLGRDVSMGVLWHDGAPRWSWSWSWSWGTMMRFAFAVTTQTCLPRVELGVRHTDRPEQVRMPTAVRLTEVS